MLLRFEGVTYGFEAWVNGTKIGASAASAYNPATFDITDALNPGPNASNTLAVQVTTKPFAYESDINDDWSLGGICRVVTLFSVPRAPDGKMVGKFNLPRTSNGRFETTVNVARPQLWTAETPNFYQLELTLSCKGRVLQTLEQRVALREVSIVDGALKLNDRPIKLHGVDHHDLDPVDARAITEQEMRRDLELMKKGNINFIRTSHCAPQPRFIDLCDELGFYVMCEVSIGKGEQHMSDPAYRDNIMARTEATVTRDKNNACVIIWSIGNENPITDLLLEAGRYAKRLDPSRPICYPTIGSYFGHNFQKFPDFVDIYSPHYPNVSTLRGYANKLNRPLILTEYAHAWGLATDLIQDEWEILQSTPTFAGGAIWHFQDQGILRTMEKPANAGKMLGAVWLEHRAGVFQQPSRLTSSRAQGLPPWRTPPCYS